MDKKACGQ